MRRRAGFRGRAVFRERFRVTLINEVYCGIWVEEVGGFSRFLLGFSEILSKLFRAEISFVKLRV